MHRSPGKARAARVVGLPVEKEMHGTSPGGVGASCRARFGKQVESSLKPQARSHRKSLGVHEHPWVMAHAEQLDEIEALQAIYDEVEVAM